PHEAIAIVQTLIDQPDASAAVAQPPYGPPSLDSVELQVDGLVVCRRLATRPAVSEIAILLQALLPPGPVPGGLRYAMGRALLETDGPPFDSIDDFSEVLARYEKGDR